jgi:NAD(P)-dependent dehydrogenase (short-subunit alcohol dehydrogenase family)
MVEPAVTQEHALSATKPDGTQATRTGSGVAVVTGGSRGIGAAAVLALAAAGYTVVFSYRAATGEAAAVVRAVQNADGRAVAVRADAAVPGDLDALFRAVDGIGAPLRVLVNNAAVLGPLIRFAEVDAATMRQVVDVNLVGAMLCTQHAVARMSTRSGGAGGAIINVSSGAARHGSPGTSVCYGVTKAGLETMTVGLAQELAGEGIRVNAVVPGLVRTAMANPDALSRAHELVPLGRAGEPGEIADAISWLAGDTASYVSGAVIRVAGGLL